MVSELPIECLTNIFEYLSYENLGGKNHSFTILHSCILVNKSWCVTAIPILWRNPWNWLIDGLYLDRLSLLVATFITCLPKEIKITLSRNHNIRFKRWMKNVPSFDYPYFMNILDYSWLCFAVKLFIKDHPKIKKDPYRHENRSMLLKELCKSFMKGCCNLIQLDYDNRYQKRYDCNTRVDDYINLAFLPGANQTLVNLKKFHMSGWIPSEIIYSISTICKNIEEISLSHFHVYNDEDVLMTLIQEQQSLKKFSFKVKLDDELNLIEFPRFEQALKSKLHKFQSLTLSPICFCMDIFSECYNLKELSLSDDRLIDENALEKFSNSKLSNLLTLEINMKFIFFRQVASLIRNTNGNLEIITAVWLEGIDEVESFRMFIDTIIFHCPNLKEYYGKFDVNFIPLLCQNCVHLTKMNFCSFNITDFGDLLKQVGDVIPVNLSRFYLPLSWTFNSDSLEYFLEKCIIRLRNPLTFNIYQSEKHTRVIKHFMELNALKSDEKEYRCWIVG